MNHDHSPLSKSSFLQRVKYLSSFILLLWLIELADRLLFQGSLENHGIHPRSFSDLHGFLFAPLLHAGWGHLLGNSLSLLVLGSIILAPASGWRNLAQVSVASMTLAGLLVWLIGASGSNHIGASSLVFGFLSFLLASGFYQRTPLTIIISILVGIFYSGAIFGILPSDSGISWESHLGGAIGGILIARNKRLHKITGPRDGDLLSS